MGTVLCSADLVIQSIGYNGSPAGSEHCGSAVYGGKTTAAGFTAATNGGLCPCVHAEQNALLRGRGELCFVTVAPCGACAKLLFSAGVRHIWCPEPYPSDPSGAELFIMFGGTITYSKETFPGYDQLTRK